MNSPLLQSLPFYDRVLIKIGFFPSLNISTDNTGLIWVSDKKDRIAVVNADRANRYRHGIQRRCQQMAKNRYLGGRQVKINSGDVVLNIGANIGEVTRHFAYCGAKVLAFEPDPKARQCLEANTRESTVEILPIGAWNENTELNFYLASDDADSSIINPSDQSISIEVKTIDSVVAEKKLSRIRLIAGDAEGGEPEVLQGAAEALKITDFVSLDCSYERRGEQTREACTEILKAAGFTLLKVKSKKHLLAKKIT